MYINKKAPDIVFLFDFHRDEHRLHICRYGIGMCICICMYYVSEQHEDNHNTYIKITVIRIV